jgi:ketosteroid isomerase-like protein
VTPRELMTDYLAAAKRGDWDTAFGYFAEDIVVHIPGRSAFAGDFQGKHVAVGYIRTIRDHYRDDEIELELIDMLVSEERVALLVCERFHGGGPPTEIRRANVYRVQGARSWRSRSSRPISTSSTSFCVRLTGGLRPMHPDA